MNRKNIPLIIAISLPFIMIAIVAAVVYLPSVSAKPQYNFIYVSGGGYYGQEYTVEQGKLVKHDITVPTSTYETYPKYSDQQQIEESLFVHDVKTNVSTKISFEDAAKLMLNNEIISPNGYQVQENYGGGGFMPFFFGGNRDYNAKYLVGHHSAEKLNVTGISQGPYSYNPYRFIGWVLP